MNRKKTVGIIVLVFVLLLSGAYVLYTRLGSDYVPDRLAVAPTHTPEAAPRPSQGASSQPTETAPQPSQAAPSQPPEDDEPGQVSATDFTVYDAEGRAVRLSDYFGKPVVVNFWASWCGPCQMEMPDFQEKYSELGEDVHFLMVNMTDGHRESVDSAAQFISEQGYTFPVFYDTGGAAAMAYGINSLPTTFFIDARGFVVAHAIGAIDSDVLQRGIDMILPQE